MSFCNRYLNLNFASFCACGGLTPSSFLFLLEFVLFLFAPSSLLVEVGGRLLV